jgi:hypothetical protein
LLFTATGNVYYFIKKISNEMKRLILIGIFFMGFALRLVAQDYFIKGVNIEGTSSDTGLRIIAEQDGYIISCNALFMNSTFGGIGIVKTDLEGTKLWENTFNSYPDESGATNFIKLPDNAYLITGGTIIPDLNWQDTFIKVSSNGDSLRTTYYGDELRNKVAFSVLDNAGNHLALSTYGVFNEYSHNILLKLDGEGEVTDSYPLADVPSYPYQYSEEMIVLPNGEYVMTLAAESDDIDKIGFIRKTDTIGNTIWQHQLSDYASQVVTLELRLLQNNNFIVAAYQAPNTQTEPWSSNYIRCYNAAGDSLWQHTFWSTDYVRNIQALSVCNNGDIICCGHTGNTSLTGDPTAWMARLSQDGALRWIREYVLWEAGGEVMFLYDLDEDPHGDLVATGFAALPNDAGQWEGQAVLLKVNSEGCFNAACDGNAIVSSFTDLAPPPSTPPTQADYRYFAVWHNQAAATLHLIAANPDWVGTSITQFALYDLQGKAIATQALNRHQAMHQVALPSLPAGIYAYTFSNSKGIVLQRGKVVIIAP